MKICAIHQPNFFPWMGYFDKIYRSDIFVFMDDVNYAKSSKTMSSWTNRVKIRVSSQPHWINCPVIREAGDQKICDVLIDNKNLYWREKLIKTLVYNYKKCPYFEETSEFVYSLINFQSDSLSEYNCHNIKAICKKLHIDGIFYRQKPLNTINSSTKLLIEITKAVDCDSYMCGGGATGYQEDELFATEGISLIYQNYKEPYYESKDGQYINGLSILDVLFNCGFEMTEKLIKKEN